MLQKTIQETKDIFEKQFNKNLFDVIFVKDKKTFELTNLEYFITPTKEDVANLVPAPLEEEYVERDFVILSSLKIRENIEKDKFARDAVFVNNYDGSDRHCISYLQYYIRDNMLSMNVYARSMNFDTNFIFDNQTFVLAYFKTYNSLKPFFPEIEIGYIKVNVFSLHKIV